MNWITNSISVKTQLKYGLRFHFSNTTPNLCQNKYFQSKSLKEKSIAFKNSRIVLIELNSQRFRPMARNESNGAQNESNKSQTNPKPKHLWNETKALLVLFAIFWALFALTFTQELILRLFGNYCSNGRALVESTCSRCEPWFGLWASSRCTTVTALASNGSDSRVYDSDGSDALMLSVSLQLYAMYA